MKSNNILKCFLFPWAIIVIILISCSLATTWFANKNDGFSRVDVTLSKMKITTHSPDRMKERVVTTDLSKYCDIDENNAKCILYKGSKATSALLGVALTLAIVLCAVAIMSCLRDWEDKGPLTFVYGIISGVGAAFLVIGFVTSTSYSSDFMDAGYTYHTGWTITLINLIFYVMLSLFFCCIFCATYD